MAAQKYNITKFESRNKSENIEQHNNIIFFAIKNILNNDIEHFEKLFTVTGLMFEITNKDLLLSTLKLFKDLDFKTLSKDISNKIDFKQKLYSEEEINRIYAIVYANFIRFNYLKKIVVDSRLIKEFKFSIYINEVNFSDDYNCFKKLHKHFILNADLFLTSKLEYKKIINNFAELDYINNTNNYKFDIEILKTKMDYSITNDDLIEANSQDLFKENGFKLFLKWNEICDEEYEKKYSYIFQKLKEKAKLRKSDFKSIINWLEENNYLNNEDASDFRLKGHFITPANILTKGRNKIFDNIKLN